MTYNVKCIPRGDGVYKFFFADVAGNEAADKPKMEDVKKYIGKYSQYFAGWKLVWVDGQILLVPDIEVEGMFCIWSGAAYFLYEGSVYCKYPCSNRFEECSSGKELLALRWFFSNRHRGVYA